MTLKFDLSEFTRFHNAESWKFSLYRIFLSEFHAFTEPFLQNLSNLQKRPQVLPAASK